jgi:hypothetical protein
MAYRAVTFVETSEERRKAFLWELRPTRAEAQMDKELSDIAVALTADSQGDHYVTEVVPA